MAALNGWENFYVIVGSAAGALVQRRHSALGYHSPVSFELAAMAA